MNAKPKALRVALASLSKTSKLGCYSWSLQAVETCPGSRAPDGGLVPACSGCYAAGGFYAMPGAKALRARNRDDWEAPDWVERMRGALTDESYFRWFDSGDMYTLGLARKMLEVMKTTPHVRHWLPTRMAKFPKFRAIIDEMNALPNVKVRFSSDSVLGEFGPEHGSVIVPAPEKAPAGAVVCGAYSRGGKCGDCRACWDKSVPVIAYPAHGSTMTRKVIPLQLAK